MFLFTVYLYGEIGDLTMIKRTMPLNILSVIRLGPVILSIS